MKQLLKENFVLIAGICLPLLLAAVFWVSKEVSIGGIAPPTSEVIFMTNYQENPENPWEVEIRDERVHIVYAGSDAKRNWNPPQLLVFNPNDNITRKIDIPRPAKDELSKKRDFIPDVLKDVRVIAETISPEGYIFVRSDGYNRGLVTEVFSGRRDRSQYILQQGNYRRQVPQSGYNAQFIGWIGK